MKRKNAPYGRRMTALIIDLFLILFMFFIFEFAVSRNIIGTNKDVIKTTEKYNEINKEFENIQDEYQIYIYEDEKRVYNDKVSEETLALFEKDERIIKLRNDIKPYGDKIVVYAVIEYLIALTLSTAFCLLLIPIIIKEGRTLGKLIMKLSLKDKNNNEIKWYQVLLRWIIQYVFEILLGIITFLVTPLISLMCSVMSKEKQSLPDLICHCKVIDNMPIEKHN